jgi:GNAT superfamily N-acetyltransferase
VPHRASIDTLVPAGQAAGTAPPRELQLADLRGAHALSLAEQWPHRLQDWWAAATLGSGAIVERGGEVVGTGMCWPWEAGHATLGLVIVRKDQRGQGLGKRLMRQLLEPLRNSSVLLHATADGRPLYEKLGFRVVGEIRQHQGHVQHAPAVQLAGGEQLRPAGTADLAPLVELDARAAGMQRHAAVEQLLRLGEAAVLSRDGQPIGFAVRRPFGRGLAIGPVVADSQEGAKALIAHWLQVSAAEPRSTAQGPFVRIDVHAGSGLEPWLDEHQLLPVGGATAMVRGAEPRRGPQVGGWALISQSLG